MATLLPTLQPEESQLEIAVILVKPLRNCVLPDILKAIEEKRSVGYTFLLDTFKNFPEVESSTEAIEYKKDRNFFLGQYEWKINFEGGLIMIQEQIKSSNKLSRFLTLEEFNCFRNSNNEIVVQQRYTGLVKAYVILFDEHLYKEMYTITNPYEHFSLKLSLSKGEITTKNLSQEITASNKFDNSIQVSPGELTSTKRVRYKKIFYW